MSTDTTDTTLPVRGLWFLSYIGPWLLVLQVGVQGAGYKPLVIAFALALCVPIALALWYGVSRRRVWGYYLVWTLNIAGVVLPLLSLNFLQAAASALGLALWGIYLTKRRHLFHPKQRAVVVTDSRGPQ
jgi:hypothetical protein